MDTNGLSDGRVSIPVLLEQIAFKPKGLEAKLVFYVTNPAIRHALVDAQGKQIVLLVGEEREPALPFAEPPAANGEVIVARDETTPAAGQITDRSAEREAALKDPFAAGKAAALHGFNETRNPFPHPNLDSAEWLRGHAEGEAERTRQTQPRRRRRRNGEAAAAAT